MTKSLYSVALAILAMLSFSSTSFSQKNKSYKRPITLQNPFYDEVDNLMQLDMSGSKIIDPFTSKFYKSSKKSTEDFTVFTDRDKVAYYSKSNLDQNEYLNDFPRIGTMLHVIGESDTAFEVAMGGVRKGWIAKEFTIPWNKPLMKWDSRVDIKAFIVNKDDKKGLEKIAANQSTKDYYKIYHSPSSKVVEADKLIYDIQFVYKYDKLENRYLLSNNYSLNDDGQLLGWVDAAKVEIWNTALAIEPNWDEKAFAARAENPRFVAHVYGTLQDAYDAMEGKEIKPMLQQSRDPADPANSDKVDLVHPSGRYKGGVPRFPYHKTIGDVMSCGAIGKINITSITSSTIGGDDLDRARLVEKRELSKERKSNTSVVFVVEVTPGMTSEYLKNVLPDAVDRIIQNTPIAHQKKMRWGLLTFRDVTKGSGDPSSVVEEKIELTSDVTSFKRIAANFGLPKTKRNKNNYQVCSRYAIKTAVEDLGMQPFDNNIIIHLGSLADVSVNRGQKPIYNKMLGIDKSIVAESLAKYRPSIISIQVKMRTDNSTSVNKYLENTSSLFQEYATIVHGNEIVQYNGSKIPQPTEVKESDGVYRIDNAPSILRIYKPSGSGGQTAFKPHEVVSFIAESTELTSAKIEQDLALLERLLDDDSSMSSLFTEFGDVYLSGIVELSPKEQGILAAANVHVYKPAFAPTKGGKAEFDPYRHVLFMKEESVRAISDAFASLSNTTGDENERDDMVEKVLSKYAAGLLNIGDDELSDDMTLSEVRRLLLGVSKVSPLANPSDDLLKKITNIKDVRSLSSEDKEKLYKLLLEKGRAFKEEIPSVENYEFVYEASAGKDRVLKFYYIPIEILF